MGIKRAGAFLDVISFRHFVLSFALTLIATPLLAEGVLYGTTRSGQLFTVDTSTGAATGTATLTPCDTESESGSGITEIEYDATTGTSFAQGSDGSFCGFTFNLATGGTINTVSTSSLSLEGMEVVNGTWYVAGIDPPTTFVFGTLNPATGVVTVIGPTGLTLPLSGLAWDGSTMYAISGGPGPANLYTIDLSTGAATLVGSTGIQAGSLEFGPDGRLYAGGTGPRVPPPTTSSRRATTTAVSFAGNIYTIDPSTAAATLLGPTGYTDGITGLMLVENQIPTVSSSILVLLGGALGLAGLFAIRRI